MAKKESDFILGFVDEQISQADQPLSDYTSCKIGGKPDWISTNDRSPKCRMCSRTMSMVVQMYAPLDGTCYHRTLYVFACITPECWNKSHSWICLRSQMLSKSEPRKETSSKPKKTSSTAAMFDVCDDWGSDDGNGNSEERDDDGVPHADIAATNNSRTNVNERIYNNNSPDLCSATMQMNLNEENTNANENICGAIAMQTPIDHSSEATALIEGPEDDVISVETPENPSSDLRSILNDVARIDARTDVAFVPYYINSDWENLEGCTGGDDDDRELFMRYPHLEGFSAHASSPNHHAEKGDATYEKTSYNRNDLFFHKFSKRVHYNPSQIIRYCREEDASPLWLRPPVHETMSRRCLSCGGRLVFELQIMPQILNALRVHGVYKPVLEFGTVAIFTCANSCWNDRSAAREEFVVVQEEILEEC